MGVAKEILVSMRKSWINNFENNLKKVEDTVLWKPMVAVGDQYVVGPFCKAFHAHVCARVPVRNTATKSLVVMVHHAVGGLLLRYFVEPGSKAVKMAVHKSVKMWVVRHVQMGGASLSKAVWVWLNSHAHLAGAWLTCHGHLAGAWLACHAPIAVVGVEGLAKVYGNNDSWVTQGLDETDGPTHKIILVSLE